MGALLLTLRHNGTNEQRGLHRKPLSRHSFRYLCRRAVSYASKEAERGAPLRAIHLKSMAPAADRIYPCREPSPVGSPRTSPCLRLGQPLGPPRRTRLQDFEADCRRSPRAGGTREGLGPYRPCVESIHCFNVQYEPSSPWTRMRAFMPTNFSIVTSAG